ncbi:MAG: hypothetical protein JW807_00505 [Spirochaetes bacterium]|nr:hypothetical protein [Spirochaetota bacterium]
MRKISSIVLIVYMIAIPLSAKDEPKQPEVLPRGRLAIELASISLEEFGPMKKDKSFKEGDLVFVNIEVKGLQPDESKKVVFQADIIIPQLNLDATNAIDGSMPAEGSLPIYFRVPIGEVYRSGFCDVTIRVRDMVAKTAAEFNTSFQLSNEVLTFHCGMLKDSKYVDVSAAIKDFPGIKKRLSSKNFRRKKEVIIQYTDTFNETVFVVVPKKDRDKYLVIPDESKDDAKAGCGKSFDLFKAKYLFNFSGHDFYRAIINNNGK